MRGGTGSKSVDSERSRFQNSMASIRFREEENEECLFVSASPRIFSLHFSLSFSCSLSPPPEKEELYPSNALPHRPSMTSRDGGGGGSASTSGRPSSRHGRTASGGSSSHAGAAGAAGAGAPLSAATMANPLSRGHSLLADYLDASGVVPLPSSEVHMNAPVPTREHVGENGGSVEGN